MVHRVPFIPIASVVTVAVILVLAALFALPLSSPGTALAEVNRQAALDQETLESRGDIGFPVSPRSRTPAIDSHRKAQTCPRSASTLSCRRSEKRIGASQLP